MSTKVFISWSGDLSNKLADAVRQWLPGVLQFVKPYYTPSDIEKGTKWASSISGELESSDVGIICLTKENITKPWILFEAGALSKNLDSSKVCTLLFGIDSTDLQGPLTTFQNTKFDKEDFKKLVVSINNSGGDSKLSTEVLDGVFDMWWPKLEGQITEIIKSHKDKEGVEHRPDREILEEVLELTRLGARRKQRESSVSPRIVQEIVEYTAELRDLAEIEGSKHFRSLVRRLDRPIEYLCRSSEYPELYEHFHNRKRHRRVESSGRDRPES